MLLCRIKIKLITNTNNITQGISNDLACEIGKNSSEEKLNSLNSHEIQIGKSWKIKRRHFIMTLLYNGTALLHNGYVAFEVALNAAIFLDDGLYENVNENVALGGQTFS